MYRANMFQNEKEWLKIFAGNLKDVMYEINYTQTKLARESGVPQSSLSRYLNAERVPALKDVIAICDVLGVSVNDMINFDCYIL